MSELLLHVFWIVILVNFAETPLQESVAAHHTAAGFRNPWPSFEDRGFRDFLKWQWNRLRNGAPEKPRKYDFSALFPDAANPGTAEAGDWQITWIGHSTCLIRIGDRHLLTDPIWSERCSPVSWAGPRRYVPPGLPFDELPRIDAVLISHNHYDHLDRATIRRLGNGPHYFVPLGVAPWLRRQGIRAENITELDWWQEAQFAGMRIVCTPAQHFSGRTLMDRNQTLWCGWAMMAAKVRIYFAGDSGYFPGFVDIGRRLGPFDVALLPIGAYRPRWFMHPVHMDPREALQAFLDVKAHWFVPIHWGTFDLADEPLDEPPKKLFAAARSMRIDSVRIRLLLHGERFSAASVKK